MTDDTRAPQDTLRRPDDLDVDELAALGAFLRKHGIDYTYTPLGRAALKVEQQRAWLEMQATAGEPAPDLSPLGPEYDAGEDEGR